jgi:cobalt-precorrin 5A hydrolase
MSQTATAPRRRFAIYAITKHGLAIGETLKQQLSGADLWVSHKFADSAPTGSLTLPLPFGPKLAEQFTDYDAHIFIISVGAVVRMISPLLKNKKVDPAVICVDDKAQFAISLLSGHVGRGNEFTLSVAQALNATPVITTASDVQGTLTVDILGRDKGWVLEDDHHNITAGCAAVVNEVPVLFVQETGEPDFWPLTKPLPSHIRYTDELTDESAIAEAEMILYVTDRSRATIDDEVYRKAVVYRPQSLVVGIGCDRGTSRDVLERGLMTILDQFGLSPKSIACLTTLEAKGDEQGLLELAESYDWPLVLYPADELDQAQGIENPSPTVKKYMGTRTVAEGAALLASAASALLVPKQKYQDATSQKNMTVAICRKPFAKRQEIDHE